MKTLFTLIFSLTLVATVAVAKGTTTANTTTEYIICQFNNEVTSTEISELQETGINVIKVSENNQRIVYVESFKTLALSPALNAKIYSLTLVNTEGQKIPLRPVAAPKDGTAVSSTPSFFSMFFNFLYE